MFGFFEYKNRGGFPCGFRLDEVTGYATDYKKNGFGEIFFNELLVYVRNAKFAFSLTEGTGDRFIKEYKEWYDVMCVSHTSLDKK